MTKSRNYTLVGLTINTMKTTVMFFMNSPKRPCLIVEVTTQGEHTTWLRKTLTKM